MEPKNEIQPPHVTFHPIDELENGENKRGAVLVGHVFQLAFAAVCDELIQQEKWEQCHGCAINHPSQRQHSCLMIDNEEAWFRYFDQVVDKVDLSRIRRIAENACGALGFKLSDKWETYVSDLPKHPRTAIYLTTLELKSAGDVVHLEGLKTCILNAIYYRVNGQYYHYFRDPQRSVYSDQELSEVEPTRDYCAQAREDHCRDIDFLANEIHNQLRF